MGSKKQNNNKKKNKKLRIQRVDSYFNSLDDGTYTVVFRPDSGLELQNEAGEIIETSKVNSSLYYDRKTKPKIVTYSDSRDLPFQSASLTLRNYKYLCAIDTNSREVHGRIVSMSVVCLGWWFIEGDYTKFNFTPSHYMEFLDFSGKSERFAWCEFLKLIEKGTDYNGINTFGVIVDSDLDDIPSINNRQIPLYDDYYLPSKMELIYASSDKADTVQNKMIKISDKYASKLLEEFENHFYSPEVINRIPNSYKNIEKIILKSSD